MQFQLNGVQVEVLDLDLTLLEVLRDRFGLTSVKDGCSPQGQCGCCTVLVDGEPRVSCVTPVRRVADRSVETLEGLTGEELSAWTAAFCSTGASQCGFCTPGIVMRLEGQRRRGTDLADRPAVDRALAAHLCRCTGWQTIVEAAAAVASGAVDATTDPVAGRDLAAAGRRATLEGGADQHVHPDVVAGRGGFADDGAPPGTLVAVTDPDGGWTVGDTLSGARRAAGKVQGRRTTVDPSPPIDVAEGTWAHVLRTSWVEPAYLETDASWAEPGGSPASPLANGGAFGGKVSSPVPAAAADLADDEGRAVRVRWSREDTVRFGPKRPPLAIGVRDDGTGVVRVARTPGIVDAIRAVAPEWDVTEIEVAGPPTSAGLRAAGWGEVLDPVVLRSYCIGAVHMALGWVTSEQLAVDGEGEVLSLTVRSFGIVRPGEMPHVRVEIVDEPGAEPVPGSDAVFVATAAAVWLAQGLPPSWPTGRPVVITARS